MLRVLNIKLYNKKKIKHINISCFFMKNNKPISDEKEIAHGFNTFFANVGPNLVKHISLTDKDASIYAYIYDFGKGLESSMFVSPLDDHEIMRTGQRCSIIYVW